MYVVLHPASARGIYRSWHECQGAVHGLRGAVYRKVRSLEEAEAILAGGRTLPPGTYAFVDGNHHGGVGVALVSRCHDGSTSCVEFSAHVLDVEPGLAPMLPELRNILAELAAVVAAVRLVPPGTNLTVVHDWVGTGHLVLGTWKPRSAAMARAVAAVRETVRGSGVHVRFLHVNGHQAALGVDEYAAYNGVAHRLASMGARRQDGLRPRPE